MRIKIGSKIIFLNIKLKVVDTGNTVLGLNSGRSFRGSHFLFLDYDCMNPVFEFNVIMQTNGLKRGLIVRSSDGKYHALSFTPLRYSRMLEVTSRSSADRNHKAHTMKNGFATLRITPKPDKEGSDIKVIKVLLNEKGTNFYHFDGEKAYMKLIGGSGD